MLFLGVVYVYGMLVALFVSFLVSAYQYIREKKFDTLAAFLSSLLGGLPVILYYAWLFLFHMDDSARSDGWISGPSLPETFLTYLWVSIPLILLFPLFLWRSEKEECNRFVPLVIWLLASLVLTLIPPPFLPFQVHAHVGVAAPMTVLTAKIVIDWGWHLFSKFRFLGPVTVACWMFLLFSSIRPSAFFLRDTVDRLRRQEYPEFVERDAMNVMRWALDNLGQESVVVVHDKRARMFAGITGCRVFFKNPMPHENTAEMEAMEAWAAHIADGPGANGLLHTRQRATHVFMDPGLHADMGIGDLTKLNECCTRIYHSGDFSLWELR
jgi:hypothetical protein